MRRQGWTTLLRLHSLTGAVPVALFLLQHLLTQIVAVAGAGTYNRVTRALGSIPGLPWIEALVIFAPLAVHAGLGVWIAAQREGDAERPVAARRLDVLQRVSGLVLLVYIVYHLWSTTFLAGFRADPDAFARMTTHLDHPGVMAFNVIGVAAAAFHLGVGLTRSAVHFGWVRDDAARRRVSRVSAAVAIVIGLAGLNALFAFTTRAARWLDTAAPIAIEGRP